MPLRGLRQLEIDITRECKNLGGFDSKSIPIYGFIKDVKISLAAKKDISILMDIVVIDVPNAWGMLLSRKWFASIGGQLQMDLSYATIPTIDGTPFVLYREPQMPDHVEDMEPFPFPGPLKSQQLPKIIRL